MDGFLVAAGVTAALLGLYLAAAIVRPGWFE